MKFRVLSAFISGVVVIALLQGAVPSPAEAVDDHAGSRGQFIAKAEQFLADMGALPEAPEVAVVPLPSALAEEASGESLDHLPGPSWREVDVAGTGTVVPDASWRKVPSTPVEVRQSIADARSQAPVQVSTRWAPEPGTGVVAVEVSAVPGGCRGGRSRGWCRTSSTTVPAVDVRVSLTEAAAAVGGVWTDSLEVTELGADLCADRFEECDPAVALNLTVEGIHTYRVGEARSSRAQRLSG